MECTEKEEAGDDPEGHVAESVIWDDRQKHEEKER